MPPKSFGRRCSLIPTDDVARISYAKALIILAQFDVAHAAG